MITIEKKKAYIASVQPAQQRFFMQVCVHRHTRTANIGLYTLNKITKKHFNSNTYNEQQFHLQVEQRRTG
jgi:hypothetical protein